MDDAIRVAEGVAFSVFAAWQGTNGRGLDHWVLRFRPADVRAGDARIRLLRLRCAFPKDLLELQVSGRPEPAYVMASNHDRLGRSSAAGEVLLALYGQDRDGCLRVPATDFSYPVHLDRATVQLTLRKSDPGHLKSLSVWADVDG